MLARGKVDIPNEVFLKAVRESYGGVQLNFVSDHHTLLGRKFYYFQSCKFCVCTGVFFS